MNHQNQQSSHQNFSEDPEWDFANLLSYAYREKTLEAVDAYQQTFDTDGVWESVTRRCHADLRKVRDGKVCIPVSYTHLTLPTKRIV